MWLADQNRHLQRQARYHDSSLSGPARAVVGDLVPNFTPLGIDGVVAQVQYQDEPTCRLLFIFSPNCSACQRQERLWLPRLVSEAEASSIQFLRLSIDEAEKARKTRTALGPPTWYFPGYALRRAYRVTAIPEVMLVTSAGRILWVHYGILNDEQYMKLKQAIPQCKVNMPSKISMWQAEMPDSKATKN